MTTLDKALADKRILVCAGAGGVGKTTTAATLALEAARRGQKALVLTIDPARRLATSMGLPRLDHEERRVPQARMQAAGARPGGALFAMMLDQKRAFDEVVTRYARNAQARDQVLQNRIYQQIASTLTGAHEYAAIAKLYQISQERDYDLIVVDTPPTAHALDFLDAPGKVAEAIDSPAVDWFAKPFMATGEFSLKMLGRSSSFVLKRVAKFVGSEFLDDMARFFVEAGDVLKGFREIGRQAEALLRNEEVGFVLVTSPEPTSVDEALFFHARLRETEMDFAAFVVNRVHAMAPPAPSPDELFARLEKRPECQRFSPEYLRKAADALSLSHHDMRVLAEADVQQIARLEDVLREDQALVRVPFFDSDVHDITGLVILGQHLFHGTYASDE